MLRRPAWPLFVILSCLLGTFPGAGLPAAVAGPGYLLGHPWEQLILDGITTQDRELRRLSPQAVAGQYQRLAARRAEPNERIRRYYLLGRAHGKNYESLRRTSADARTAAQKQAVLDQASRAHQQALRAYQEATQLAPGCYFAYHDMAILELQRPRPDHAQAINYLLHSAKLNPRYPSPLRKLAIVYREQKQYDNVIRVLTTLLRLAPDDVVAKTTLAAAYAETGRTEAARKIVDELLRADPANVGFRSLKADLDFRAGRLVEAQAAFKQLAEANPSNPMPLEGYLRCLDERRKQKQPFRAAEYVWVMDRMLRFERRPEVREKLREQIKNLKQQQAEQANIKNDGKPPSAVDLVKIMTGPNEEGRFRVLSFLNAVNQPPPKVLLDGILSRLSALSEASGRVRALAVEIAGRHLGWGWMPIARLVATQDPDARVRASGLDAIIRMSDQGPTARAAAMLIAGLFLEDKDRSVAAAARLSILALGDGRLRVAEDASDVVHREAFTKWWRGASGEDLKIESLRRYVELKDPFVDDVLAFYVNDASFFVRQAVYEACVAVRNLLKTPAGRRWYQGKRRRDFANFERWVGSLPVAAPDGRLTRENAGTVEPLLQRWWKSRPR